MAKISESKLKKLAALLEEDDEPEQTKHSDDDEEFIIFKGSAESFFNKFGFKLPKEEDDSEEATEGDSEPEGNGEKQDKKPKTRHGYFNQ